MEANLLRGFAGLVNELRQRGLGVRQYIWRSRDDSKVRSAHAAHDDQVFSWDNPPEGGHPGQAFNCRCIAEPLPPGPYGNVVLAELTIPSDGITSPGAEVGRRLPGGLIARTAAGLALYLALEANRQLQGFTAAASQQRVVSAATTIGADLGTVEGLWAAITYAQAKEAASTGLLPGVPKDGPGAEVFAQGIALYAMANPEALRSIQGFNEAVERVGGVAVLAWQEGRLRTRDGNLASGWAEVFPELTDDEKRLGQLPGFTPERIEEFREEYPAEVLGLPDNTGSAPDDAPVGNAISTPVPEEVGPNIVAITNPHSKETISIPEDRKIHILDGDGTGGGHRSGTGAPKKSEFPFDWTDEMILDAIREVAGTGTVVGSARRKGELLIAGEIDGVQIEVVVKPNGEVRTAYPTGGPGVIRNP